MSDAPYPPLEPQPGRPVAEPRPPYALIIGVALLGLLAIAMLLILLTGGEPAASGSPSPSASASASASAPDGASAAPSPVTSSATSPSPSAPAGALSPPDGILPVGSLVEVISDGLRLREEPTTGGAEVATLPAGAVLYLASNANTLGPVQADGYSWYVGLYAPDYRDWPLNPPGSGDGPSGDPRVSGWFAAGTDADDYVQLLPARCPVSTDIDGLYAVTAWERLACLGDQQLTVEGTYGCGGCGGLAPGTFEPAWLASPLNFNLFTPPWAALPPVVEQMALNVPPDIPQLESEQAGSVLRVTGHFNDSRSADCVIAPGEPGEEVPADDLAAEWYCRLGFVVESWEVVGTDPDWQGG